jgi:hypothetical protein
MRLTFWRRPEPKPVSEATKARMQAERDLVSTKAETVKYRQLAESFIEYQRVNHLGQSAARILRGDN